jgi:hypothetical protein
MTQNRADISDWNVSFERIQRALHDPKNHTLCAHMWEWPEDKTAIEINVVLECMAGNTKRVFIDNYRRLHGDPTHGFRGLACTALFPYGKTPLFDRMLNASQTGLLLVDAPPVLVSPVDVHSRFERDEGRAMEELSIQFDHNHVSPHAKKLFNTIMAEQLIDTKTLSKVYLDVTSKPIQMRARQAYRLLAEEMAKMPAEETTFEHNEVCVNARSEHIAGIVVQDKGNTLPDAPDEWAHALEENPMMVKSLHSALMQLDRVKARLAKQGIEEPAPTIVIYRPLNPEKLLHFPPTRANRMMIDAIIKEKGLLGGTAQPDTTIAI